MTDTLHKPATPAYWVLRCNSPKGSPHALFAYEQDHYLRSWLSGARFGGAVPQPPSPIEVHIEQPGVMPELTDDGISLMSGRLRACLDAGGVSNLDYYDAVVVDDDGQRWPYQAFNIIGRVAGLAAGSRIDRSIPWIDLLRLDEAALRDCALCRLAESPSVILVRDDIRRHIEDSGITTLSFVDPARWAG